MRGISRDGTASSLVRSAACLTATSAVFAWMAPAVAFASEGAKPVEKATEGGVLGPPVLYTIQWSLLLLLLAVTVVFIIVSYAPELRRRTNTTSTRIILAFSAMQILLVLGILIASFLGEGYFEPPLPGYFRHVTLVVTGVLVGITGLMARRKRF